MNAYHVQFSGTVSSRSSRLANDLHDSFCPRSLRAPNEVASPTPLVKDTASVVYLLGNIANVEQICVVLFMQIDSVRLYVLYLKDF